MLTNLKVPRLHVFVLTLAKFENRWSLILFSVRNSFNFFFQLKIEQRDGTPLTGRREDVNVSARVTYMLPELESTPYPWYYPARNYMDLPNKIYSVPDSGLVAIQLNMPFNATSISLTVSGVVVCC